MSLHVLWRQNSSAPCFHKRLNIHFFFVCCFFVAVSTVEDMILGHSSMFYFQSGLQHCQKSICVNQVWWSSTVWFICCLGTKAGLSMRIDEPWNWCVLILLYSLNRYLFCFSRQQGFHPHPRLRGVCTYITITLDNLQSFWGTWEHTVASQIRCEPLCAGQQIFWICLWIRTIWTFYLIPYLWRRYMMDKKKWQMYNWFNYSVYNVTLKILLK